jgi:hypothetical protein
MFLKLIVKHEKLRTEQVSVINIQMIKQIYSCVGMIHSATIVCSRSVDRDLRQMACDTARDVRVSWVSRNEM